MVGSIIKSSHQSPGSLGISISKQSVSILAFGSDPEKKTVTHGYVINLDPDKLKQEGDRYVSREIKQTLDDLKIKEKTVCFDISGDEASVFQFSLPVLTKEELRGAVEANLINLLEEESTAPYCWDFVTVPTESQSQTLVVAVLVKREILDRKLRIMKDAGLQTVSIDFRPFAFWKSVRSQVPDPRKTHALFVVDDDGIQLSIFSKDQLTYYRSIPAKVAVLLNPLEQDEQLNPDSLAALPEGSSQLSGEPESGIMPIPEELIRMRSELRHVGTEIRRSFDYAKVHNLIDGVDGVFVIGETDHIQRLAPFLGVAIEQTVMVPVLFESVVIESELSEIIREFESRLTVAFGLASGPSLMSLLPPHVSKAIRWKAKIEFARKVGVVGLLVVVATMVVPIAYHVHLNTQIKSYQNALGELKTGLGSAELIQLKQQAIEQEQKKLSKIVGANTPVHLWMMSVSKMIPDGIVLTEMSFLGEEKRMAFEGVSHYRKGTAEQKLSSFMEALENSKFFKDVQLAFFNSRVQTKSDVAQFLIKARVVLKDSTPNIPINITSASAASQNQEYSAEKEKNQGKKGNVR